MLHCWVTFCSTWVSHIPEDKTCTDTSQHWNRPRNIPGDGPIFFLKYSLWTIHTETKAEVAAARLDKYKWYCASPAVLSEKRIQHFCTSLESHESVPLFTAIMRGNDCDPLLTVSPSVSSMLSSYLHVLP